GPKKAGRDGVEGDADVVAFCHVALDDFHQLGIGFVARQCLAGTLVLVDASARDREDADERDEIALGEELIVGHRRRQRERRAGNEGQQQEEAGKEQGSAHWIPLSLSRRRGLYRALGRRARSLRLHVPNSVDDRDQDEIERNVERVSDAIEIPDALMSSSSSSAFSV